MLAWSFLLLIRGILAALRQKIHLATCPNSPGHLSYGETLSGVTVELNQNRTVDGLLHAVSTLTTETARASERNRALEQQLAASSMRITKLRQNLAEAKQESTTDSLTGLCNRRAFDARLRRAVARAKANRTPLSLVLIDIDHFKRFNDTYGHRAGDLVLRLSSDIRNPAGGAIENPSTPATVTPRPMPVRVSP